MQIDRWRDSATLLQYALSLTPDSRMLENNLGTVLGERGRYQEAEHFTKALQTKPDFMEAMSVSDADIRNQSRVAAGASGQTDGSNGTAK
jgi:Tfp pilus assembly protein PilF